MSASNPAEVSIQPQIPKDDLTVILPVLDEEAAVGQVLDELKREGYSNILVVDGYSQDDTVNIARAAGAQVIVQHGTGKTGGIKTAIEYVESVRAASAAPAAGLPSAASPLNADSRTATAVSSAPASSAVSPLWTMETRNVLRWASGGRAITT